MFAASIYFSFMLVAALLLSYAVALVHTFNQTIDALQE